MATLFHMLQFFDNSGEVLSEGKLFWEEAGMSVPKTTWKDAAETSPHTNPINLGMDGRAPGGAIFLRGSYKLRIKDKNETTTYQTIDYINEYNQYDFTGLTASIADLNSTTTTAVNINFPYTVTLGDRGKTLLCDASSVSFGVTLPQSSIALDTFEITIKKVDSSTNAVMISPAVGEKIDTMDAIYLDDFNDSVRLHNDGSNWKIVARMQRGTITNRINTDVDAVILSDDKKLFNCNCSSGNVSLQLPNCLDVGRGFEIIAKKVDTSTTYSATLLPSGSQTIDGLPNFALSVPKQSVTLKTDGLNWFVINNSGESGIVLQTGFVIASYAPTAAGWVTMDDGTMGDVLSGGTTRANNDTASLFAILWNNLDPTFRVIRSGGTVVAPGATAAADFAAHRTIDVPKALGRALCSVGGATPSFNFKNGQSYGNYYQSLARINLPDHPHSYEQAFFQGGARDWSVSPGRDFHPGVVETTQTGMYSQMFEIVQPITCLHFLIKL